MDNLLHVDKKASNAPPTTLSPDNFESLYKSYVGRVYQKCLAMTKDSETAQDFTQDIFIKVFEKLGSFQNRSTFSTWLYSVSHNYCVDQIRMSKRFNTETLSNNLATAVPEQDYSTSVEFRLQVLESLMKGLPAKEIAILKLKHEQGLSIKEIAEQYLLSESAVKMRLKRTREKLYDLYMSREC